MLHFSSRSIIVELHKENNQPLYKYLLKNFKAEPIFDQAYKKNVPGQMPMTIQASRMIEVPINSSVPKPYIHHQANKVPNVGSDTFDLQINVEFHDIIEVFNAVRDLFYLYKQKGASYEDNLQIIIFQHYKFAQKARSEQFDTTRVKKLNEKKMLPQEIKIKYIMPLVSIDGLIFITDERIYMQPLHPQILGQSVLNLKIRNVKELFKRRYTLMDIAIEIVAVSPSPSKKGKKKTMYLVFNSTKERDTVYQTMLKMVDKDCTTTEQNVDHFTQLWVKGAMTNFDYLMLLNSYAQRSF